MIYLSDKEIDKYLNESEQNVLKELLNKITECREENEQLNNNKPRIIQSDEDCADCLCRVCARNSCNDSYNHQLELEGSYKNCECNCNIGDILIETELDCPNYLPDEEDE